MSKIQDAFLAVCPALQAEYGDHPIPVKLINEAVASLCGCTIASVCVADHCYNWHNNGNSVKLSNPKYFVREQPGFYFYKGPDYAFVGEVYAKPQGSSSAEVIARRENGILV